MPRPSEFCRYGLRQHRQSAAGNGDGTFRPAVRYPVGYESSGVAVADFNHDGIADLAVTSLVSNDVTTLLGNGDGSFRVTPTTYVAGVGASSLAAGDFTGDGFPDLAVADHSPYGSISVLLNDGNWPSPSNAGGRTRIRPAPEERFLANASPPPAGYHPLDALFADPIADDPTLLAERTNDCMYEARDAGGECRSSRVSYRRASRDSNRPRPWILYRGNGPWGAISSAPKPIRNQRLSCRLCAATDYC